MSFYLTTGKICSSLFYDLPLSNWKEYGTGITSDIDNLSII